ncbi:hypothetical protein GGP90_002384 [Salinibacter ruber]|nr:hypothetical protein [Salinibacter ruber]
MIILQKYTKIGPGTRLYDDTGQNLLSFSRIALLFVVFRPH